MKRIRDILKELFNYGIDVIIVFSFLNFFEEQFFFPVIIIIYCLVRFYFIKHVAVSIFLNLIFIYSLISISLTQRVGTEEQIILLSVIYVAAIAIVSSQVFVIILRSFSTNLVKPPNSNKPIIQILLKTTFIFDSFYYVISVILAFVYPILLTLTIVLSFSGLYANINTYYNIEKNDSGLIYSLDQSKLDSIKLDSNLVTFKDMSEIIKKDYFYFSSITYFTIGYGDITPIGHYLKTLISIEMMVAHILNISFFALFGTIFYDFIKRKKIVNFEVIRN